MDLNSLESGIASIGYDWVDMPLVTGANGSDVPMMHTLRMISDYTTTKSTKKLWTVSIEAEMASSSDVAQ